MNNQLIILENFYRNREIRLYKSVAPTIRAGRFGLLVLIGCCG